MSWSSLFDLRYLGPATESGSMRISDLAPALLSLNDLFTRAHELVNAYPSSLSLNVQDVHNGSHLSLALVENLDPLLVNLFTPDGKVILEDLVDLIVGPDGLLSFIDLVALRSFEKDRDTDTTATILFDDNDSVVVDKRIPHLYNNPRIRQYAYGALQPLEREGITRVSTRGVEFDQERLKFFDPPVLDKNSPEIVVANTVLAPETVHFTGQKRWRFNDGESSINAVVADDGFLERVAAGSISISSADRFQVRLRTTRWQNDWGSKLEYVVEKVLEHRSPGNDVTLFG